MVHYNNLENILSNGILSHNEVYRRGLINKDISMDEVQKRRAKKNIDCGGKSFPLHDFVSFYFNSRNPMLYKRKELQEVIVVILVDINVIDTNFKNNPFAIFSDGNAGSDKTSFFSGKDMLKNIDFNLIYAGSWNHIDSEILKENKRKRCSEVLVYPAVNVESIKKVICPNKNIYDYTLSLKNKNAIAKNTQHIEVSINRQFYF